jgi:hypothetical protein
LTIALYLIYCNYSGSRVQGFKGSRVQGSRFKVKTMKEGLYSSDKDPVHPLF